jgi:hypothetical protein
MSGIVTNVKPEEEGVTQKVVESPAGIGGGEVVSNNTAEQNTMGATSMASPSIGAQNTAVDSARATASGVQGSTNETSTGVGATGVAARNTGGSTPSALGIQDKTPVEQPKEASGGIGGLFSSAAKNIRKYAKTGDTTTTEQTGDTGDTTGTASDRKVDYTQLMELAEADKTKSIQQLEEDAAVAEQNAFNRLTHDGLAKDRNSGAYSATKMATIRRANNLVFDGKRAIDANFTKTMLDIAEKKAIEDADFNQEQFKYEMQNNQDLLNSFIDSGDKEGARDLAALLYAQDPVVYSKFGNEKYLDNMFKAMDKEANVDFEETTWKGFLELAANTSANEETIKQNMQLKMDENPEIMSMRMDNFFDLIPEDDYENLGINDADKEIIKLFNDGDIDINDPDIREIFVDAYRKDIANETRETNIKNQFGDMYDQVKGTAMEGFLDEVVDVSLDPNKNSFDYDGNGFYTYGQALTGENIGEAPGVDYRFSDWDNNEYGEGRTFLDSESQYLDGDLSEFTNGQMNELYSNYHKESSKKGLSINEVMDKDRFRSEVEDFVNKQEGEVTTTQIANFLKGKSMSETGITAREDQVIVDDKPTNLSEFGIDVDDYVGRDEDLQDIKDIITGEKTLMDIDVSKLNKEELTSLADSGKVPSYSNTNLTLNEITIGMGDAFTWDDQGVDFQGDNAVDLYNSLQSGEPGGTKTGRMVIGGQVYYVKAEPTVKEFKGKGNNSPAVQWTLTPLTGEGTLDTNETQTIVGTLSGDEGRVRSDNFSAAYAKRILSGDGSKIKTDSYGRMIG